MIYVGKDVFNERLLRKFQLFEEFLNCIVCHHMFLFTDFCSNWNSQELFGWSMIGIVSLYYLFQQGLFYYRIYELSRLTIVKFERYFKYKIPIWTRRFLGKYMLYREDYMDVGVEDQAKIKPEPLPKLLKSPKKSLAKPKKKKKKSKKRSKTPAKNAS